MPEAVAVRFPFALVTASLGVAVTAIYSGGGPKFDGEAVHFGAFRELAPGLLRGRTGVGGNPDGAEGVWGGGGIRLRKTAPDGPP